jgi:hypothetical protein
MKYISLGLAWLFGLFFLVSGFNAIIITPLPAILSLGLALLILPPIRQWVYAKSQKRLTPMQFWGLIVLLFVLMGITYEHPSTAQAPSTSAASPITPPSDKG